MTDAERRAAIQREVERDIQQSISHNFINNKFMTTVCASLRSESERLKNNGMLDAAIAVNAVTSALMQARLERSDEIIAELKAEVDELTERYDCPIHGTGEGSDCPRC